MLIIVIFLFIFFFYFIYLKDGTVRRCEPSLPIQEQDAATKAHLQEVYGKENIYKASGNYVGFGVSSDLKLRKNDIVGVIKKADPCGNPNNWFVDNGRKWFVCWFKIILFFFIFCILGVKGIIPASILQHFDNIDIKNQKDFSQDIGTLNIIKSSLNKERHHSIASNDSFEEDDTFKQTKQNKDEYCIALYNFDAVDSNTLSICEGEMLKILQKSDDNSNSEWWLVEKEDNKKVGYVPSNYVQLVFNDKLTENRNDLEISSNSNDSDMNASAVI